MKSDKVKQAFKEKKTAPKLSLVQQKYNNISGLLGKMKDSFEEVLPKHITPERIIRIALTSIRTNPKLLECSEISLIGAILQSAQLGLEPNNLGQAWLIPYNNRTTGKVEVQFQIGYRGLIELFYRHEASSLIDAHTIYENDVFSYQYGTNQFLHHQPAFDNRGAVIGYYAFAKLRGEISSFKVMSVMEIDYFRDKSKTSDNGPWVTDYNEMAKKTVIKRLCKYLPISVEIQKAISVDETSSFLSESDNEFNPLNEIAV